MSEISNVCKAVGDHCLQAIKAVYHHANGRFDWLISGYQSVNPWREAISILSGKHKRFTFVHSVISGFLQIIKRFIYSPQGIVTSTS